MDRVRSEARCYAELGLRAIQLHFRTKWPTEKGWPAKATCDLAKVQCLFDGAQPCNLGIATGGGLVVVDIDPRNGGNGSWDRLVDEQGSPPATATARTGGGGRHLFFRVDPGRTFGKSLPGYPGIDLQSDGRQVVAAPSIHAKTGMPYEWLHHPRDGIAPAPDWLVAASVEARGSNAQEEGAHSNNGGGGKADRDAGANTRFPPSDRRDIQSRVARSGSAARGPTEAPCRQRKGNQSELADDLITRFDVSSHGTRHSQMCRAVGSLVGLRYDDETVLGALMLWWQHFADLCLTRTGREGMEAELVACLRSTRSNTKFADAISEEDHETECARIELSTRQKALLAGSMNDFLAAVRRVPTRSERSVGDQAREEEYRRPPTHPPPNCKRVTQARERLCMSDHEAWFVEALLVVMLHQGASSPGAILKATNAQLTRIAGLRHPDAAPGWKNQQIDRLKKKYVSRHERAATVVELARVLRTGTLRKAGRSGTPSEYEVTGLLAFVQGPTDRQHPIEPTPESNPPEPQTPA